MTLIEASIVTLGLHAVIVASAFASWALHLSFPAQPPLQVTSFIPTAAATIPPPPPAAPKPQVAAATPTVAEDAFVAPTVIPDEIPDLPEQTAAVVAEDEAVVGGVEGGVSAGIKGGVAGGIFPAVEAKGRAENGVVVIPLDARLPMRPLSQVYPHYPEDARIRGQEGSLVVRYIIDRRGRVREVKILRHAEISKFDESVVKAIRGWRFRPMVDKGEAVEVMHDLTVYFRLEPL